MKQLTTYIVILLLIVISFFAGKRFSTERIITKTDTLTVVLIDTIKIIKPKYITEKVIDSIPFHETLQIRDTIWLPKTQKIYKDTSYQAWVSGYKPNLDSIKVFNKTITNTITKTLKEAPKRFGIGVSSGMTFINGKFTPYIGIGVSYNIFRF